MMAQKGRLILDGLMRLEAIQVCGHKLENVENCNYFSIILEDNDHRTKDIRKRIFLAKEAYISRRG
jgi:hypothetical protein